MSEYIVIGTGISALGVLKALSELAVPASAVKIIRDNRNIDIKYPNTNQLLQSLSFGGNGKYWHGVVPLFGPNNIDHIIQFLNVETGLSLKPSNSLFVPKAPYPKSTQKSFGIWRDSFVDGFVNKFYYNGSKFSVHLDDQVLHCNKLIIAAGCYGTNAILKSSNFEFYTKNSYSDHICGTYGLMSKKNVNSILGLDIKVQKYKYGYTVPALQTADGLLTFRPAHFEMKSLNRAHLSGPIFANKKIEIVKKLISLRSFGKIAEAVSLKTGLFYNSDFYSVHYQRRCESVVCTDNESNLEINRSIAGIVDKFFQGNSGLYDIRFEPNYYFGTHLHNCVHESINTVIPGKLLVCGPSVAKSISDLHHTYFEYYKSYMMTLEMES